MIRALFANPTRGFVTVLVLLLLVILTIAVVGQLAVSQTQHIGSLRGDEQLKARAIAEQCVNRGIAYLNQLRKATQPNDFDSVLDPDLNSHPFANGGSADFDDDFVPNSTFGGAVVYVPASESGASGQRQALHRFRFFAMNDGGCLVRFDDNNDDGSPGGGSDNAVPVIEGTGEDVAYRDRDMGIFVTGMGIYPVRSGTAAADAYKKAHARVTLKRFVSTGGAPAVVANGDLIIKQDVAVCGIGGFQGDDLTYEGSGDPSTVCSCGDTATVSGAAQPSDCNPSTPPGDNCPASLPCQPGASVTLGAPPVVDVEVPTSPHWLDLGGFQDPKNPKGLGDNLQGGQNVCEFYFRSDNVDYSWTSNPLNVGIANDVEGTFMSGTGEHGEMFVWDHTDNDAQGCEDNLSLAACPAGKIVTHNCMDPAMTSTSYLVDGKPVVKRPCAWNDYTATQGPKVHCPAALDVTPCWKLVAAITTAGAPTNNMQQDSTANAAADANVREDTFDSAWSESFRPKNAERVPNIEAFWGDPGVAVGAGTWGIPGGVPGNDGTAVSVNSDFWTTLCGPCPNCDVAEGWGLRGDEHFHFEIDPMCSTNFFSPSFLVFENQVHPLGTNDDDGRFHVKKNWGGPGCGGMAKHTVIVQSHADMDLDTRVCGVWSDCTPVAAGSCNPSVRNRANGFVVSAGGQCYINAGAVFTGDFRCGQVHVNVGFGSECLVGDIIAWNDAVATPMGSMCLSEAGFPACTGGICIKENVMVVGDLYSDGDICLQEGAIVSGSLLAGGDGTGDIFIAQNTTVNGQLVSEGDIGLKEGVVINNDGGGVYGSRVSGAISVEPQY